MPSMAQPSQCHNSWYYKIPFERLTPRKLEKYQRHPAVLGPERRIPEDFLERICIVPRKLVFRSLPVQRKGFISGTGRDKISLRVIKEVICSHDIHLCHHQQIREKEHFNGFLSLAMKYYSRRIKQSKSLFKVLDPGVEHRPLLVHESFSGSVR
jgi:hypothetical protein